MSDYSNALEAARSKRRAACDAAYEAFREETKAEFADYKREVSAGGDMVDAEHKYFAAIAPATARVNAAYAEARQVEAETLAAWEAPYNDFRRAETSQSETGRDAEARPPVVGGR